MSKEKLNKYEVIKNVQFDERAIRIRDENRKRWHGYRRILKKRIPIIDWIYHYDYECAVNDLMAGITLGLTIIPESIACALLAGLPAHYGLCSAFMGSFIYLLGGSIYNVIMGPTSLVALVSVKFTVGKPIEFAFALTFLSGIVQIIMGVTRIGFLFEYISLPMIKGFSSATAILVMESQIKILLGIDYLVAGFLPSIKMLIQNISYMKYGDLIVGVTATIFLIIFQNLEKWGQKLNVNKVAQISLRYLSFARNTLIVLLTGFATYLWWEWYGLQTVPYNLTNSSLSGIPKFTLPQLTVEVNSKIFSLWDILKELNVGIIVIPVIGILTNISIGKLSASGLVDTNQELLVVGLCNIVGSCVQSMPTSGAFTRYAISSGCGLKTPMANLYSGTIVLITLNFLTVYFNLIPKATLAAILICSIYNLIDLKLPIILWKKSKSEFFIWLLCFSVCILCGVEIGLSVSIVVNILQLLYMWARPDFLIRQQGMNDIPYINVTIDGGIYFPAISRLRSKILKTVQQTADQKLPIVIDCCKVNNLDFTAAQGLIQLADNLLDDFISDSPTSLPTCPSRTLIILENLPRCLHKMIDKRENLVVCNGSDDLNKILQQNLLCLNFLKV